MLQVGDIRVVDDGKTGYYESRIVAERGEGEGRQVKVHYNGYKKRNDEWIDAGSERILQAVCLPKHDWGTDQGRLDEDDDQWEVRKLTGKRRRRGGIRQYEVEWVPKEDGTPWPLEFVNEDDIYQSMLDELKNPPQEPRGPYVETQPEHVAPEVADFLVEEWTDDISRKGADMLSKQRGEWASRKFFSMSPCPPWLFKALHRKFRSMAEDPEDVCDIYAVRGARGGKFVEDQVCGCTDAHARVGRLRRGRRGPVTTASRLESGDERGRG